MLRYRSLRASARGTSTMGSSPTRSFLLSLQFLHCVMITAPSSSSSWASWAASPATCGQVNIPYPFALRGSGRAAAPMPGFDVACDRGSPTLPGIGGGDDLQVLEIDPEQGYVSVGAGPIAQHCRGDPANQVIRSSRGWINLEGTPFTFSQERNKFTLIGCDALSMMQPSDSPKYTSGCVAYCDTDQGTLDQSCLGIGCCQAPIPRGLRRFNLKFRRVGNASGEEVAASGGNCSRAFLVDGYDRLKPYERNLQKLPLMLNWVIGYETCAKASQSESFPCKENTQCVDKRGLGYICICPEGYSGNPYLPNGCQDIDECKDSSINDCIGDCINVPGAFHCKCPRGMMGDGRKGGSGCMRSKESQLKLNIYIGAGVGALCLVVLVGSFWVYCLQQRRRVASVKEKFFRQNGGLLLQKQIDSHEKGRSGSGTKIFTSEEIEKATHDFSEKRILGRGGQGTVYKGVLPDKRVVAIKRSRISDETQVEQFVNELVILSQINHKNVVKLLGCCLETQVPLLVYEFVPNGTLSDLIHGDGKDPRWALTWEQRLGIAAETAGALAHLHSAASVSVIHRDVKSANILLDKNLTAKVSDFGVSRSVPFDGTHITTLVQGTLGYLDPEYFQTSQLTEKSDVYSFGVVLVELLTGERPMSSVRPEEERNLALHFISSLENKRLRRILEAEIVEEVGIEHLGVVARLAQRCLSVRGEERPTMKEVAMELEWARRFLKEPTNMVEGN